MTHENILDVIHQRTSIRSFTDEAISDDFLLEIAKAGRASPTANNKQNRTFSIVKNKELISQLAKAIGAETDRADYHFFNAAALLLVSVPDAPNYSLMEIGAASQNIMLAATSLNIGSVWTSQIIGISDQPAIRSILDQFNIPKNHQCYNIIALGHPAENPKVKERTEKIHFIS